MIEKIYTHIIDLTMAHLRNGDCEWHADDHEAVQRAHAEGEDIDPMDFTTYIRCEELKPFLECCPCWMRETLEGRELAQALHKAFMPGEGGLVFDLGVNEDACGSLTVVGCTRLPEFVAKRRGS